MDLLSGLCVFTPPRERTRVPLTLLLRGKRERKGLLRIADTISAPPAAVAAAVVAAAAARAAAAAAGQVAIDPRTFSHFIVLTTGCTTRLRFPLIPFFFEFKKYNLFSCS